MVRGLSGDQPEGDVIGFVEQVAGHAASKEGLICGEAGVLDNIEEWLVDEPAAGEIAGKGRGGK